MSGLNFNVGENGSGGNRDGLVDAWEKYLLSLKDSDPEEYKALIAELESEVKRSQVISTSNPAPHNGENEEESFSPVLPGGSSVMGEAGIETKKESLRVIPEPSFVIKTKDDSGKKIFINVCKSDLIQRTSTKKHLAEDGSEQEGMNVPLSLGPPRPDKDKSGSDCIVYDIIVNPEVIEQSKEDKTGATRNFLCELAIQYVEQKYKCKLDPRFKLPKMRYKGDVKNVPHQFIRKNKAPVIEEVETKAPVTQNTIKAKSTKKVTKSTPLEPISYKLERKYPSGKTIACDAVLQTPRIFAEKSDDSVEEKVNRENNALIFTANLSLFVMDAKNAARKHSNGKKNENELNSLICESLHLSISQEFLSIKPQRGYKCLEVFLPEVISVEETSATFDSETGILTLVLPIEMDDSVAKSWMHSTGPDPGSRPWLLASAVLRDEATCERIDDKATSEKVNHHKEEPDTLPEDRFHLHDMLSMHIKEEREKNRQLKEKEQEKKEREQKQKETEEKLKEMDISKIKLLDEVKAELQNENAPDEIEDDSTDILELF